MLWTPKWTREALPFGQRFARNGPLQKQIRIILIDETSLKLQGPPTRYNIFEANSLYFSQIVKGSHVKNILFLFCFYFFFLKKYGGMAKNIINFK